MSYVEDELRAMLTRIESEMKSSREHVKLHLEKADEYAGTVNELVERRDELLRILSKLGIHIKDVRQ